MRENAPILKEGGGGRGSQGGIGSGRAHLARQRWAEAAIKLSSEEHSDGMRIPSISITLLILAAMLYLPACDSPDDEAEPQTLDVEDDNDQIDDHADHEDHEQIQTDLDITMNPKPTAAGCHFKVIWPSAGVYEQPASGPPLKSKHAGDIVGDWCFTAYVSGNTWQSVTSASAQDGIGWMRLDALTPI